MNPQNHAELVSSQSHAELVSASKTIQLNANPVSLSFVKRMPFVGSIQMREGFASSETLSLYTTITTLIQPHAKVRAKDN